MNKITQYQELMKSAYSVVVRVFGAKRRQGSVNLAVHKKVNTLKPVITITYCPKCRWLLRAAYMAQEFLTTFEDDISGVLLQQAEIQGQYSIALDEKVLFDRKQSGGFKDIKELKQLVRDKVAPDKGLGHSDNKIT